VHSAAAVEQEHQQCASLRILLPLLIVGEDGVQV
jgi:hypothetical protein